MIAHVASHNINIGDGALNSVIQSYIKEDIEEVDVVGAVRDNDFKKYSKVIVGGGGAISNRSTGFPLTYPISPEELDDRFSFIALGYNLFNDQPYEHSYELERLFARADFLGIPFSVRMDGSKERILEEVGIDVEEIPDPGLFVEVDDSCEPPEIRKDRKNIVIQLAGDNLELREQSKIYIPDIGELIRATGANIIFAPHITRDLGIVTTVVDMLPNNRSNINVTGIYHPSLASKYFKIYKDADLVIGMRGHAAICGVGLGTPTMAIDTHPKVGGFMRKVGLEDWIVTKDTTTEDIIARLNGDIEFKPKLEGLREKLDNFMGRVLC